MNNGFYAKKKEGKTLFSFEWTAGDELILLHDNGQRQKVDKNDYEIVNMEQITVN